MAHVADELEHDRAAAESEQTLPAIDVPDIVADKRQLRVVPWAGEGPDPLGDVTG